MISQHHNSTRRALTVALALAAAPAWAQETAAPDAPAQNAPAQAAPAARTIDPAQTQALFNAMRAGNREAARAAILAGADANVTGQDGMTALMRAAQLRQPEIVQLLLEHGANPGAADKAGRTALHYAVPEAAPRTAEAPKPKKKKKWGKVLGGLAAVATGGLMGGMMGGLGNVLGGGLASSVLGGMLGGSPMGGMMGGAMVGAMNGQTQVLGDIGPAEMAVIEKINAVAATGDQAAMEALMKTPAVDALMQKLGAARSAASAQADEASRSIVSALLQKGASPTADKQGKTPLALAQERGLGALAQMLGAKPTTAPATSTPTTPTTSTPATDVEDATGN